MTENTFFNRQAFHLRPDSARVVVRPFKPATEPRDFNATDRSRANNIVDRVLAMDAASVTSQLADVLENFRGRHRNLLEIFDARADEMGAAFSPHSPFTADQRRLVGAYFLHEYSFEAAALFNPSIVTHPGSNGDAERRSPLHTEFARGRRGAHLIADLPFRCDFGRRQRHCRSPGTPGHRSADAHALGTGRRVGRTYFQAEEDLSERVIFPVLSSQSNGIEDARFVEFEEAGERTYYATYTAYTGRSIRSELLETRDFVTFRMSHLNGSATHNKGMALFPRKIGGQFAMIGRQDNENIYLIHSDDLYTWNGGKLILKPQFPWEFVQIGNCGSPH